MLSAPPESFYSACGKRSFLVLVLLNIFVQAGGNQNVPAIRLYERFGFTSTEKSQFNAPNDNLFVLWDIHNSLQSIDWKRLLQPKVEGTTTALE
jgi:hypothetical protein